MIPSVSTFISRESQLRQLGQLMSTLRVGSIEDCSLVYGPQGVGKTSVIRRALRGAGGLPFPVVSFLFGSGAKVEGLESFFGELARGVESEWPELKPYVDAFTNYRAGEGRSVEELLAGFVEELDRYFFQTEQQDTRPELKELQLLFVIEDLDKLDELGMDCLRKLVRVFREDANYRDHFHFLFSGEERSLSVERIQLLLSGDARINEILVPPFCQPETDAFLKMYEVDPSLFAEVQMETAGFPARLVEYCKSYQPEDPEESELLKSAEILLKNLSQEQQEWVKIAALLSECTEESLGLFLSKDQRDRALKWMKVSPSTWIERGGDKIRIAQNEKKSLEVFQKKENPGKLKKRSKRVHQYESVIRVIPKLEHRKYLSVLAEFESFDRGVLSHVFGAALAEKFLKLVEDKTVFFTVQGSRTRLSQNTHIMMQLYNKMFPVEGLQALRTKVLAYWAVCQKEMEAEILSSTEKIDGNENIRDDVRTGISQMDQQIESLSQSLVRMDKERKSMIVEVKRSGLGYVSIIMQILGIICLYFAVLYRDEFMVPVLIFACVLITLGFAISLKRKGSVKVSHRKILRHSETRSKTAKELEKLKQEKLKLAARRDQSVKAVNDSKDRILELQLLLKLPYMR